jgi:hypothetical protein
MGHTGPVTGSLYLYLIVQIEGIKKDEVGRTAHVKK